LLQHELMALYSQYRQDLECATVLQSEYLRMVEDARGAHREALARIRLVRRLLDLEFPGWDTPGQLRLLDEE